MKIFLKTLATILLAAVWLYSVNFGVHLISESSDVKVLAGVLLIFAVWFGTVVSLYKLYIGDVKNAFNAIHGIGSSSSGRNSK